MERIYKFTYLESTSKPIGLLEQLGVAITLHPSRDGAMDPIPTWFCGLLSENASFVWSYKGKHDSCKFDRKQLAEAYFSNQLSYTAFDLAVESRDLLVVPDDQVELQVKGMLNIKGVHNKADHYGAHDFTFKLIKEGGKWKMLECHITQNEP